MKKMINLINGTLLFALITTAGYAQTQPQTQQKTQTQVQEPKALNDPTLSQRLQKDLNNRNAMTANKSVTWYDAGYGYYGTYAIDTANYMVRYDKKGNYVETLMKKEWDDQVPPSIVSAINQSPFKDQNVTSYWEVNDYGRKGYYVELDDKGKVSRIWLNEQGKISSSPETPTTKSSQIN